jgi:hypothetical protein
MKAFLFTAGLLFATSSYAQNLQLKDLSKLIFSKSIDSLETFLRKNNYVFESTNAWKDNKVVLVYYRPLNTPKGYDRLMITTDNSSTTTVTEILHISTYEEVFFKLKAQCDAIKGITKAKEFVTENGIYRSYCNGYYEYDFMILNDAKYRRLYDVKILYNNTCALQRQD